MLRLIATATLMLFAAPPARSQDQLERGKQHHAAPILADLEANARPGDPNGPALLGFPVPNPIDYTAFDDSPTPANGAGAAHVPLLGGALAIGRTWPKSYPSVSLADWQRGYFGFDDPEDYRCADNVVYRVDRSTAAIQMVAAFLTGNEFTLGRTLPRGYDVYNVPAPYRDRYADSAAALYRYADGRIYRVDPATLLIAGTIDMITA